MCDCFCYIFWISDQYSHKTVVFRPLIDIKHYTHRSESMKPFLTALMTNPPHMSLSNMPMWWQVYLVPICADKPMWWQVHLIPACCYKPGWHQSLLTSLCGKVHLIPVSDKPGWRQSLLTSLCGDKYTWYQSVTSPVDTSLCWQVYVVKYTWYQSVTNLTDTSLADKPVWWQVHLIPVCYKPGWHQPFLTSLCGDKYTWYQSVTSLCVRCGCLVPFVAGVCANIAQLASSD